MTRKSIRHTRYETIRDLLDTPRPMSAASIPRKLNRFNRSGDVVDPSPGEGEGKVTRIIAARFRCGVWRYLAKFKVPLSVCCPLLCRSTLTAPLTLSVPRNRATRYLGIIG